MVRLSIKKGNEAQFLFETTVKVSLDELIPQLVKVYNGRLKIDRLYYELETLAKHGHALPPNMQGLTDEQVIELKLRDEWEEKCIPSGGSQTCPDPVGRRSGKAPLSKMADVINKTRDDSHGQVSKDLVTANKCLTMDDVQDALDKLRGAIMIVYPMGLPPHDPARLELENNEDLSGTQAAKEVLEESTAQLWWAGKELTRGKKLEDFVGKNEKTKIVVKIQKKGQGAPAREPVVSEEDQRKMMAHYHRKQEEMKRLDQESDDNYLNSEWADSGLLKRQFHGVGNIKWR